MANLASLLTESAAARPEHTAIILDDVRMSYGQLDELAARAAGWLKSKGVGVGDRVVLVLPNVPHMPVLYYALLRLGAVVVPLNPLLTARELAYHFQDAQVRLVLAWQDMVEPSQKAAQEVDGVEVLSIGAQDTLAQLMQVEPIRELADRDLHDTAVVLYTSGTTGRPKGAELTHDNLIGNAQMTCRLFGLSGSDVMFGALPFFHIFGQTVALNAVMSVGGTVTLLPRFDAAKMAQIIIRDNVSVIAAVPGMYVALLHYVSTHHPEGLGATSLRATVTGGAPMPVEVLRKFEKTFGVNVYEGYGLSETSPVVAFNKPDGIRKPGSIGTPVEGAELAIVDGMGGTLGTGEVGELAVRGRYVMKGYWRKPEATEAAIQDGWFHTGDMAMRDEDGVYFIVDRKKDMILRGGYNVYPREIEEALYQFPAVVEAAVVGVPDEEHGEEVAAVVVLDPKAMEGRAQEDVLQDLDAHMKEHVAKYKYPRIYRVVDELPKGPTGKILKRELAIDA